MSDFTSAILYISAIFFALSVLVSVRVHPSATA